MLNCSEMKMDPDLAGGEYSCLEWSTNRMALNECEESMYLIEDDDIIFEVS